MDLSDLRSYIESQRRQLQLERAILKSGRRTATERRSLETLEHSGEGYKFERSPGDYASQVSDALSQRICSLNSFKDQVLDLASEKENLKPPEFHEVETTKEIVNCSTQKVCPVISTGAVVASSPQTEGKEYTYDRHDSSNVLTQETSCREEGVKDIKVEGNKTSASTIRSREEEVERLQKKLASASFWDDFGRSATAKKWGPEIPDTMVRIGEFSPANPELQAPGKTPLGLGEYEERRRQLLERKKQEYKDYLAQNRSHLQRTDHLVHPSVKNQFDIEGSPNDVSKAVKFAPIMNAVDASTQTEYSLIEQHNENSISSDSSQATLMGLDPVIQPLSPREKLNMELQHHCAPCFVPRSHASQTTEQLPDARLRQLQLQEELRLQIEEKRRLEAERREQERIEEEALQKRVAEQQARLQVEYERDERLRREREIQKQQQIEDFQRRQEELRAESEALKLEERRQKLEAADTCCLKQPQHSTSDTSKASNKSSHLTPPAEQVPISIKSTSPPLRSPRRKGEYSRYLEDGPPSPRALIKVLDGPSLPRQGRCFEDSLPIPLMPVVHNQASSLPLHKSPNGSVSVSPHRSPQRSPNQTPDRSPRRSPSRFVTDPNWPSNPSNRLPTVRGPSDAMRNLEERWKVPAVQKNVCVRGRANVQNSSGNVLTQLGAFRRQLQLEHMRMEETVRQKHQLHQYNQKYYQHHNPQRGHQY